ncbi:MAG: TetR/AcrR family transcriptional regulator [Woeseiaceae bacterium]
MAQDWLVGDRSAEAAERIYAAAADLVTRNGFHAFTIEALAKKAHCSPATIYRHVGGKNAIRDAVTARLAARIVATVRDAIKDLHGADRVVTAVVVALQQIRAEPLGDLITGSARHTDDGEWLTESPMVSALAEEMIGGSHPDPAAAQWLIRVVFSLWYWPANEPGAERQLLERFLGPLFVEPSPTTKATTQKGPARKLHP